MFQKQICANRKWVSYTENIKHRQARLVYKTQTMIDNTL